MLDMVYENPSTHSILSGLSTVEAETSVLDESSVTGGNPYTDKYESKSNLCLPSID